MRGHIVKATIMNHVVHIALVLVVLTSALFAQASLGQVAVRSVEAPAKKLRAFGPPGGWAFSIAIDPHHTDTVYVGLHGGGIIKSMDGGRNWMPANTGLTDLTVMPLVIDFKDTQTIYAGTHVGIFKSTDGAKSWSEASAGLTTRDVWSLALDPQSPDTL